MNTDLHKRLEETANVIYPISEIYNDPAMEFVDTNSGLREAFKDGGEVGIELGYKEAIARAKEWLSDCIHNEEHISSHPYRDDKIVAVFDFDSDKESILSDFERVMNNFWEERK